MNHRQADNFRVGKLITVNKILAKIKGFRFMRGKLKRMGVTHYVRTSCRCRGKSKRCVRSVSEHDPYSGLLCRNDRNCLLLSRVKFAELGQFFFEAKDYVIRR